MSTEEIIKVISKMHPNDLLSLKVEINEQLSFRLKELEIEYLHLKERIDCTEDFVKRSFEDLPF
jgi:hypothetical protein